MAGITEVVETDVVLKLATKFTHELEQHDIFTHLAVVNILNQLVQHRGQKLDQRAAAAEKRLAEQEGAGMAVVPHLKN